MFTCTETATKESMIETETQRQNRGMARSNWKMASMYVMQNANYTKRFPPNE